MAIATGGFDSPRYGAASLADLAPSVLASLGVPRETNRLGLGPAQRACVLLVDGLGWEALLANAVHAPFLSSLAGSDSPFTAGFPTTTATSLTSLGTGAPPGSHGVFGYQVAVPGEDRILNSLRWSPDIDPEAWQPHRTIYERARAAGVATAYVASGAFEGGGFTRASARGAQYRPAEDIDELAAEAEAALRECGYVFVYHSVLDTIGHVAGVDSDRWREHLSRVDRLAERLATALPPGGALYVTADHGMVDVAVEDRVDVEEPAELSTGVRVLAGEPRMRQIYTRPGAEADVLAAWTEWLADRATVLPRADAVRRGWFGQVDAALLPRIGDVLALAHGSTALIAPTAEPAGSALLGQHGSLTTAELYVPLLRVDPLA
ncbi:alkaline phosphatase family protein [Nocardiopsis ansamitocini]|uniref:Alkaline phosphatase family protein n=1 Tax=Nocardiopsis ansamitocini TaxID=1670832 RepID=A0A9W6P6P7_9ACTN|nr:alkaline phosphatase family protein [Nocardiopsis ansamitocini]GLU48069.1 alkaline phosphatase family protein [Nocardiopsis ansamitocini]